MTKKLLIVESPSKAKSITTYLGDEYDVISSKGHIRDLATSGKGGLGVDVDKDFEPTYVSIKGKSQTISDIKKHAKGKEVYLATDPDREGEAIAWHIADILSLDLNKDNRVIFKEITKNNVIKEIKNPRKIDMSLVRSQETRRIVDRIIGFKLSGLVKTKAGAKSAGRVQSVALELICDLEKEIQKFVSQKYFDIKIVGKDFEAPIIKKANHLIEFEEKEKIQKESIPPYEVVDIKKHQRISKPKKPFITSTLQQEAFNKLGMSSKYTMSICQELYEGVEINGDMSGLITYMRTDSTRLSPDFIKSAYNVIEEKYGKEYLGVEYSIKNSSNTQDAHEAIRPTNLEYSPEYVSKFLDGAKLRLYTLIYNRALSCLMANAISDIVDVIFESSKYQYKLEGISENFLGFTIVEKRNIEKPIPNFNIGDKVLAKLDIVEKETQPPARYNEASLIKKLEEKGIGRPSTYSQIISTLKNRDYIDQEKKSFTPTEIGMEVSDKLVEFFPSIMDYEYTSNMESELDDIALNKVDWLSLLREFYNNFLPLLQNAYDKMPKYVAKELDEMCPNCGKVLVLRRSKYGQFAACSGFPKCKYIKQDKNKEK